MSKCSIPSLLGSLKWRLHFHYNRVLTLNYDLQPFLRSQAKNTHSDRHHHPLETTPIWFSIQTSFDSVRIGPRSLIFHDSLFVALTVSNQVHTCHLQRKPTLWWLSTMMHWLVHYDCPLLYDDCNLSDLPMFFGTHMYDFDYLRLVWANVFGILTNSNPN